MALSLRILGRILGAFLICQSLSLCAAAAGRVPARPVEDADTLRAKLYLEAAVAYFNDGQYADAERGMLRAYELRPVPELQYNLGQCQERLGAIDRAVSSYRSYLKNRPDAEDAAEVVRRIGQLEERMHSESALMAVSTPGAGSAATAPPPATAPAAGSAAAPPPAEKVIFKEIIVYKEPPPKAGRQVRAAGLGLLGLTAAGLATGIVFSVETSQLNASIDVQATNFNTLFNLDIRSCSDMALQQAAVSKKASQDAAAFSGGNAALQQMITDQLTSTYGLTSKNICSFYHIASDNGTLNTAGAVIGYAVAGLSLIGSVSLLLYARHLDRKQERELATKNRVSNLSWLLTPYGGPAGAGLVLNGRF